jgi:hypothetical protein
MAVIAESVNVQSDQKPSKFETKDDLSDITLIVEDKKFYIHKTMLGYSSLCFVKCLLWISKKRMPKKFLCRARNTKPS